MAPDLPDPPSPPHRSRNHARHLRPACPLIQGSQTPHQRVRGPVAGEGGWFRHDRQRVPQHGLFDPLEHRGVVDPPRSALDVLGHRAGISSPRRSPIGEHEPGPAVHPDGAVIQPRNRALCRLRNAGVLHGPGVNHEVGRQGSPQPVVGEIHSPLQEFHRIVASHFGLGEDRAEGLRGERPLTGIRGVQTGKDGPRQPAGTRTADGSRLRPPARELVPPGLSARVIRSAHRRLSKGSLECGHEGGATAPALRQDEHLGRVAQE